MPYEDLVRDFGENVRRFFPGLDNPDRAYARERVLAILETMDQGGCLTLDNDSAISAEDYLRSGPFPGTPISSATFAHAYQILMSAFKGWDGDVITGNFCIYPSDIPNIPALANVAPNADNGFIVLREYHYLRSSGGHDHPAFGLHPPRAMPTVWEYQDSRNGRMFREELTDTYFYWAPSSYPYEWTSDPKIADETQGPAATDQTSTPDAAEDWSSWCSVQ
ncbi:hypothetical protein ACFQ78_41235 [Streptomyces sp. NPDC056519]|uniref:hypothetical protein n=1 Tax=Streptomyces sp. NPDC056519 TaxID=3345849 RepID=UPI0036B87D81